LRSLLASLTAVMLFAHAVLGCCAHHVHGCGKPHGSVAVGGGNHPCSDSLGGHSTGCSERTGHEHQGQDECQGSTCDFGRPANERYANSCDVSCQFVSLPPSDVVPALLRGLLEHDLGATCVLPPVRLHLVHQVLLV
jgi:hypothetical protein